MHTTLGKHHLLFRWYRTSSWSSWSSCCWPLRCCRTCGRCTWSSLGRCRSSGPAGPPGLSQQRRLPAVIQQLNNWISSLVLLSFKTYSVQNNISLFHLKTEGKEGTIKESVHEEHLAWKGKHIVQMYVWICVFSRIRVLVSLVGLVNSVNLLPSELFWDTCYRFNSFTSFLNRNLFLQKKRTSCSIFIYTEWWATTWKKRASNRNQRTLNFQNENAKL